MQRICYIMLYTNKQTAAAACDCVVVMPGVQRTMIENKINIFQLVVNSMNEH